MTVRSMRWYWETHGSILTSMAFASALMTFARKPAAAMALARLGRARGTGTGAAVTCSRRRHRARRRHVMLSSIFSGLDGPLLDNNRRDQTRALSCLSPGFAADLGRLPLVDFSR